VNIFYKKIIHPIVSSPHKQKQQTITKQQKRKMSTFDALLKYSVGHVVPEAELRAVLVAKIKGQKSKRRVVQMPRNLFSDERTLNQREQLRAKLRRKQEQKAKAEAEQSKSN
jgi:hypothetical protein